MNSVGTEQQRDSELRLAYSPDAGSYEPMECEHCGRHRVERLHGGKVICEKCHWDNGSHEYDLTRIELRG